MQAAIAVSHLQAYDKDSVSANDVSLDDVSQTDAYRNFHADLSSIDTKAQVTCARDLCVTVCNVHVCKWQRNSEV